MGISDWSHFRRRILKLASLAWACGILASTSSAQWPTPSGRSPSAPCPPGQVSGNHWSPNFANQGFPSLGSFSCEAQPQGSVLAHQPYGNLPVQPYGNLPVQPYGSLPYASVPDQAYGAARAPASMPATGGADGQLPMWAVSPYDAAGQIPCGPQYAYGPAMVGPATGACCAPLPVNRFYGGFEFLWMRAHFDQNVAMIIDPPVGNILVPFDYDFQFTPRTWLGWQGCDGGGFRATYWRFDSSAATESATAVPGAQPVYVFVYGAGGNLTRNAYGDPGETLVSNHSLTLQALDLEATQRFNLSALQCVVGAGVRLADMDQHMRGDIYDAGNALWEVVTNDLSFRGVGPTASLQLWRPLANTRLAGFSGMRGAVLYSETRQAIYEMKDAYVNEVQDVAEAHEMLSMGEMSIGLQYTHSLGQRAQVFARGSYEGQVWFDVGGPVDSHSTVGLDGIGLATGLIF